MNSKTQHLLLENATANSNDAWKEPNSFIKNTDTGYLDKYKCYVQLTVNNNYVL